MSEPALLAGALQAPEQEAAVARAPLRAVPDAPPARALAQLELPPYDLSAALELERELGVGHVLAQILVRRGFSDARAARDFL
ncbi:MAG: hypothetical protein JOZ73_09945, partial [Solirubrobacterales bacterium]|nr:hypothetical protein [Solirubrobacterales bacterium]